MRVILSPTENWSEDFTEFRLTFDMTQQPPTLFSAPKLLVPEDEPYEFDRLSRKPLGDLLTRFATHVDRPCTIAINAAWGHGKTTFLRMWAAHLKLEQSAFLVIEVNAWKTDYFNDPFVAIVGEMTKQLEASDQVEFPKQSGFSKLVKCFTKVASIAPRVLVAPYIALTGEDVAEIISTLKTDASLRLEQYKEQLASVEAFRTELKNMAQNIRDETGKPLIVLIDELDRCRPTYAVEFLEVVKHLMTVDHVVYAFAMNRSELSHTVSSCYGPEFDGKGYLRRFFDVDFTLPQPSRRSFIRSLFKEQLESLITDFDTQHITIRLLQAFLDAEKINLRQIQQALYRFRVILVLGQEDIAKFPNYAVDFCTALILRVYDPNLLEKFLRGELSDDYVVINSLPSAVRINTKFREERLWFETVVIRAAQEITGPNSSTGEFDSTPLLRKYEGFISLASEAPNVNSDTYFGQKVIENVQRLADYERTYDRPTGMPRKFRRAVKWLEMQELRI